jgi:hypothetical protein
MFVYPGRGQSIAASTEEIKAPGNNRRTKRQQVPAADPFDLQIDPFVDLPPTVATGKRSHTMVFCN